MNKKLSFWLYPDYRFVESGACGGCDSGTFSLSDSWDQTALSSSSYTGSAQTPSVHIKNFHNYLSTHVQLTNERPHRANSFKTSGHSRQSSSYIQYCRTDLLSSLSTTSAKDIKWQG